MSQQFRMNIDHAKHMTSWGYHYIYLIQYINPHLRIFKLVPSF